jgi:pSer/pThr/pTyr-binding forkhead associated (FHA) protein/tetratricopeptide (TPR) repeat protein
MTDDHRPRSRRRPRRPDPDEVEGPSTEEELEAAEEDQTLDDGPIHQELARRGLQEPDADQDEVADLSGEDDALVFDEDAAAEAGGGETFVGELPLDDEAGPEGGGEKTEILQVASGGDEEIPVLTVETADGQSSDVEVVSDKFIMGRSPDSDLVIPDSLISRHHATIEKRDDGWYLVDNNSGNGTFLNDERIRDELLYDGDVIQLGDAIVTFTAPGGAADQAPRLDATQMLPAAEVDGAPSGTSVTGTTTGDPRKRKRKKLLLLVGVVAVLLLGLGLVKKFVIDAEPEGPTPAQIAARKQAERAKAEKLARADFEKVKEMVKQEQWQEALPLIRKIADFLKDDKTIQDYRATIEKEAAAETAISTAGALLEQEKYDEAIAALAKLPAESMQADEAEKLKQRIEEARMSGQLEQARQAMLDERWDDAITVADELLQSFPDSEAAAEIKRKAEEAKEKHERKLAAQQRRKRRRRRRPVKPKPPPKPKYLLVGKALDLYRAEKIDEALSQASNAGVSADGVKTLRRFQQFYKRGMEMARNPGQSAQGIKFLTKAVQLDRKLGGGKGQITRNLKEKLAKVYFLQGVDAHTRKKYPLAYKSFVNARRYNPGLDQATKRIRQLEVEAKKLFETAYVIKTTAPEKAVKHCRTVMGMVEKKNVYYGKCKKLIGKIRGPLGSTGDGAGDGF